MKINDLNPSLYGVFSLLSIYGRGGRKAPGLTLALDFRYKTFSSMTYRFWVINILMPACGKQYFWSNDFQSSFQGKVPPIVHAGGDRSFSACPVSRENCPWKCREVCIGQYFELFSFITQKRHAVFWWKFQEISAQAWRTCLQNFVFRKWLLWKP